ncbi:MAG: peptidylprolyl isomerase [Bacilli bacterium]|nr:peptidylprolyl isomerase [Bacilli bacterium]
MIFGNKKEEKLNIKETLHDINYKVDGNEASLNYDTENPVVAMYIDQYGSIVMELYPDKANNTVRNFISLVKSGYYDDNTMHRYVKDFVLQGGDPTGTGSGGPGYTIKGEFSGNGVENDLKHTKGVISMARNSVSMDSAGSQFFICLEDSTCSSLDGQYAAFGKVLDGWDTIENITKTVKVKDSTTGALSKNLKIKKALVDLKGKSYDEPEKMN